MAFVQIGLPSDASTIRIEAGQVALELHRALARGREFKENFLDRYVDAEFTANPPGFLQADVTILKNAFGDLVQLDDIARGNAILAAPKDFFLQLGKLRGPKS